MIKAGRNISIAEEGFPFIVLFLIMGMVLLAFSFVHFLPAILGSFFIVLTCFCIFFFRDPEIRPVVDPSAILAPGQGRVFEIAEEQNPYTGERSKVVKIFLSIFDVHIQRAPIAGEIKAIDYKEGKFMDARNPRASFENEQNLIVIENERHKVVVKQIAGLLARRIACWVSKGEKVGMGQRLGLIRFGSQVDVFLPKGVQLCVAKGDRVISGVSVVAIIPQRQKENSAPGSKN